VLKTRCLRAPTVPVRLLVVWATTWQIPLLALLIRLLLAILKKLPGERSHLLKSNLVMKSFGAKMISLVAKVVSCA